jgi:2-dehydro-3-deoxyphosphogluconate aldolase / (4S)-4-hydroxy-2-oxoglutarate aldolase
MDLDDVLTGNPVLPVATLPDVESALPMADALLAGGVSIVEISVQTTAGLTAIRRLSRDRPRLVVGAGALRSPDAVEAAVSAGARFLSAPGLTPRMADALASTPVPTLPGVGTAGEAMNAAELGFRAMKLFPAVAAGGLEFLRAVAGQLPELRFCPTGGINPGNVRDFLKLPNVPCVSGSWVTSDAAIRSRNWSEIERLAKEAAALR